MTARTIVVGVDGSSGSDAAVKWCVEHAPLLDAHVLAVHALPPLAFIVPATVASQTKFADEETLRAGVLRALDGWCEPLRDAHVDHESRMVDGVVAATLMEVAAEVDADLVVVGRRGHGGFSELVLGSVPHTLSHHCDVPVVIVPVVG